MAEANETTSASADAVLQLQDHTQLHFEGAGTGKQLGRGAFGRVVLCSLPPHGPVALKALQPADKTLAVAAKRTQHAKITGTGTHAGHSVAEQLFLREAKTLLKLDHP